MSSPSSRPSPPALAVRLLQSALEAEQREGILGDLEEVFERQVAETSPGRARRWYWGQALRLGLAFAVERRRRDRAIGRSIGARGASFGGWVGDLRLGLRLAHKNLWLTVVAVGSLGAAMALVIVGFSLVWPQYVAPLPFEDSTSIVAVRDLDQRTADDAPAMVGVLREWRERQTVLESLGAYTSVHWEVSDEEGGTRRFRVASVTASAFDVARVPPAMGRSLRVEDERPDAPPVIVVGHRAWRALLDGSAQAIGRTLEVDGVTRVVVGVMPEGYRWPISEDLWIPLRLDRAALDEQPAGLRVFGRLSAGVTPRQAEAELQTIRRAVADENPSIESLQSRTTSVVPYVRGATEPGSETAFLLMFVFFVLVLLVACASVSNLLLARSSARSGEIAVRAALGASRSRLVGQLFVEALVLALAGAALGLGVAHAGLTWFDGFVRLDMRPFWIEFALSPAAVAFAFFAAFVAAAVAGVGPALKATGSGGARLLHDEDGGRSSGIRFGRLSGALTVVEVTLSVAFLAGAALAAKSFVETRGVEAPYPADRFLTASVRMSDQISYRSIDGGTEIVTPEGALPKDQWPVVQDRIRSEAGRLSGARGAVLATRLPGDQHSRVPVELEERPGEEPARVFASSISPGLFDLLGAPLLAGRDFDSRDARSAERVAIVNRSLAIEAFGSEDVVGRRLRVAEEDDGAAWLRVVGVAPDLGMNPGNRNRQAGFYTPLSQGDHHAIQVAVLVDGAPLLLALPLREAVRAIDPRVDVGDAATLADAGSQFLIMYRMMAMMFVGVGLMALLLAVAGLYAVMAFSVARRRREIGLRVALGASPLGILRVVLSRGLRQIGLGLVLGSIAGTGVLQAMNRFPVDFASGGPGLLAGVGLVLLVAGVAACAVPAARSLRLHPVDALRHD